MTLAQLNAVSMAQTTASVVQKLAGIAQKNAAEWRVQRSEFRLTLVRTVLAIISSSRSSHFVNYGLDAVTVCEGFTLSANTFSNSATLG